MVLGDKKMSWYSGDNPYLEEEERRREEERRDRERREQYEAEQRRYDEEREERARRDQEDSNRRREEYRKRNEEDDSYWSKPSNDDSCSDDMGNYSYSSNTNSSSSGTHYVKHKERPSFELPDVEEVFLYIAVFIIRLLTNEGWIYLSEWQTNSGFGSVSSGIMILLIVSVIWAGLAKIAENNTFRLIIEVVLHLLVLARVAQSGIGTVVFAMVPLVVYTISFFIN